MKAQTKLAIGMIVAIMAVLIASQSTTHTTEVQKLKRDRSKIRRSEDVEKAKTKTKKDAIRDASSGSENIR
jgi:hypothetical protein